MSAFGSVWAKFNATSNSAELSTCSFSGADATDSIIEIYRIELDKECSDTGQACVADNDCADGLCEPSNRVACGTRVPIACNDNILVGCSDPNNSKACVTGLEIGATYLVQVAAMTAAAIDKYSLRLRSPCPGNIPTPPQNDHCERAVMVLEGTWPYNMTDATMDCPYAGFDCLPPIVGDLENPYAMNNDVWFDYFVTQSGLVTIQTCEGSPQTTPDTTLAVYEGFGCTGPPS